MVMDKSKRSRQPRSRPRRSRLTQSRQAPGAPVQLLYDCLLYIWLCSVRATLFMPVLAQFYRFNGDLGVERPLGVKIWKRATTKLVRRWVYGPLGLRMPHTDHWHGILGTNCLFLPGIQVHARGGSSHRKKYMYDSVPPALCGLQCARVTLH